MKSALHGGLVMFLLMASLGACTSVLGGFTFTNGTGGAGGASGTGGATTCMACASAENCPTPSGDCSAAACVDGCCSGTPLALDTKCSTPGGGAHCNGKGQCVACVVAEECPMPSTLCQAATCSDGVRSTTNNPASTTCSDSGGQVCNSEGACVACQQATDCPATNTACATRACVGGACTPTDATSGFTCNDSGGSVCDGAGKCVACVTAANCTQPTTTCQTVTCASEACSTGLVAKGTMCTDHNGVVCDGLGNCVATHCTDGIQDGGETGVDCGGTCAPCADGMGCKVPADCTSGYCVGGPPGTCTACTTDLECAAGDYCDTTTAGGTCTPMQPDAKPCTSADQCTSGYCADGVCCNVGCVGTCVGCTMAHTGLADGTCGDYSVGTTAPAGQCPTSATLPCGNDGRCGANAVCEQTATGTACGTTCLSATETTNQCNGSGACAGVTSTACPGNLECASNTSCLGSCASDAGCAAGFWCNTSGTCIAKGAPGATCTAVDQCTSGFCVDGFCCNAACNSACEACAGSLTGTTSGTCAPAINGTADPRGICATTAQTSCGTDGNCTAGACADWPSGTNCTTVCTAGTETLAACNGTGTCAAGASKACSPYVCGAGTCKTGCMADSDCIAGDYCWLGACVKDSILAAGPSSYHACVLTTSGAVQCWGYDIAGQLGNNAEGLSALPVAVVGLSSGVTAIALGDRHTCALIGGAVQCWGDQTYGQLGNGVTSTTPALVPVAVMGLPAGIVAITAGGYHTCAVTATGGVLCWGFNDEGQLGNNTTTNSAAPVPVMGLSSGVAALSGGETHTCALTTGGGVQCWGAGVNGELGNNLSTNSSVPVNVTGLGSGVAAIATGENHTCALTTAGGVQCWGQNTFGELGNGTTTGSGLPVNVTGLSSGVVTMITGSYHTCAVTTAGAVKCWGDNSSGQLGNDTMTNSSLPVTVTGLGAVGGGKSIAAGQQFTCAVTAAGAQCWGDNSEGELGNGGIQQQPRAGRRRRALTPEPCHGGLPWRGPCTRDAQATRTATAWPHSDVTFLNVVR